MEIPKLEYYKNTEWTVVREIRPQKMHGEISGYEEQVTYTTGPFQGLAAEEIWYNKDKQILERVEYTWEIINGRNEQTKAVWYNGKNEIYITDVTKITEDEDGHINRDVESIQGPGERTIYL